MLDRSVCGTWRLVITSKLNNDDDDDDDVDDKC